MSAVIEFVRTATFSAAHRYYSPALSLEENKKAYGSLYREEGFGHNFLVEACFSGAVDSQTGMIASLVDVDRWMKTVAAKFDHKFLNELPAFAGVAPTPERIAREFFRDLAALVTGARLKSLRLREGEQLWIDYRG